MGADLVLMVFSIPIDKEPNWNIEITQDHIERFSEDSGISDDPEEIAEVKDKLRTSIDTIHEVWDDEGSRHSQLWTFPLYGFKCLISGGETWGEPSSAMYEYMSNLVYSGLYTDMGFD